MDIPTILIAASLLVIGVCIASAFVAFHEDRRHQHAMEEAEKLHGPDTRTQTDTTGPEPNEINQKPQPTKEKENNQHLWNWLADPQDPKLKEKKNNNTEWETGLLSQPPPKEEEEEYPNSAKFSAEQS